MKLATREIIRELDRKTIEEYGVIGLLLMENAGRGVVRVVLDEFPEAKQIAIFAGGGNNGGDGFVAARHLLSAGKEVITYLATDPDKISGDALTNFEALKKIGGKIVELKGDLSSYERSDLIIDALLGTGLESEVKGFYKRVIEFINSTSTPVVAVDLPSGLDCNTGQPLGVSVKAEATVTFVAPKLGLAVYPGAELAGRVFVVDITVPKFLEDGVEDELITFKKISSILKPRSPDTHKGTYGFLFVLSGSPGKTGAATLVALGALRVGVGLVSVGIPKSLNPIMEEKLTEAMTEPLPETESGTLRRESVEPALEAMSQRKTALAIGPGISTSGEAGEFLYEILRRSTIPIVVDADGITLIAQNLEVLKETKVPIILTPHPGEMGRLVGKSPSEVQGSRIAIAREFSSMYNVYTVLKGARTLVGTPGGKVFVNPTGNPGMASGGVGDVLTGVIGGFLAQGYSPEDSSLLGVFLHGFSGDLVATRRGEVGIIANDIADALPEAIEEILHGRGEEIFHIIR